ncbi:unnamed protein product [Zymoseptoria tritici ST99CH_1E4]|uniref:Myb-like domain-containing protein n=1 Tax=Zymoseptoria tritici ST99CH_1E4 TaxID=1276532 RepID=A0A2H1H9S1_ZYMTR|nr:unnamed protein product [Zymoseptoria tritici ST99CH_1E4]
MNGVAERGFRTDREKASSMMFEANLSSVGQRILSILDVRTQQSLRQVPLPETVALDAFEHAIWLKNRSPTRAMKNKKTSWEFTTGIKPDLSSEHIFGSRVHVNIPPERRRKSLLNLRSWPGYFVGFEKTANHHGVQSDEEHFSNEDSDDQNQEEENHDGSAEREDEPELQKPTQGIADGAEPESEVPTDDIDNNDYEIMSPNRRNSDLSQASSTPSERARHEAASNNDFGTGYDSDPDDLFLVHPATVLIVDKKKKAAAPRNVFTTEEEDQVILDNFKQYPKGMNIPFTNRYEMMKNSLPGRSGETTRRRWQRHLDPDRNGKEIQAKEERDSKRQRFLQHLAKSHLKDPDMGLDDRVKTVEESTGDATNRSAIVAGIKHLRAEGIISKNLHQKRTTDHLIVTDLVYHDLRLSQKHDLRKLTYVEL